MVKNIFNHVLKTITIYNIMNKSRAISSGDRVADFESAYQLLFISYISIEITGIANLFLQIFMLFNGKSATNLQPLCFL
jgi:predicted membrane channel-forming protein YqfA (hemolysin III family)